MIIDFSFFFFLKKIKIENIGWWQKHAQQMRPIYFRLNDE